MGCPPQTPDLSQPGSVSMTLSSSVAVADPVTATIEVVPPPGTIIGLALQMDCEPDASGDAEQEDGIADTDLGPTPGASTAWLKAPNLGPEGASVELKAGTLRDLVWTGETACLGRDGFSPDAARWERVTLRASLLWTPDDPTEDVPWECLNKDAAPCIEEALANTGPSGLKLLQATSPLQVCAADSTTACGDPPTCTAGTIAPTALLGEPEMTDEGVLLSAIVSSGGAIASVTSVSFTIDGQAERALRATLEGNIATATVPTPVLEALDGDSDRTISVVVTVRNACGLPATTTDGTYDLDAPN